MPITAITRHNFLLLNFRLTARQALLYMVLAADASSKIIEIAAQIYELTSINQSIDVSVFILINCTKKSPKS